MQTPIQIFQNDAGMALSFRCRDEDGNPIDLTQFAVDFHIHDKSGIINSGRSLCAKPNAPMGIAEYSIQPEDTLAAGLFYGRLRLQNGGSVARTIGDVPIKIQKSLH